MFIKNTGVKNLISLASIGEELKKGQSIPIKDDAYWNSDIQIALKMGWITADSVPVKKLGDDEEEIIIEDRMIECENTHHRPIAINEKDSDGKPLLVGYTKEVRPGQRFTLRESELDTHAIKNAISRGMIKILSSASHKHNSEETTLNVTGSMKSIFDTQDDVVDMGLDTNEEMSTPESIIDPEPIKDERGIVWNMPDEVASVKTVPMMNVITDENPDPVDSNRDDPKRRSVVVDPNKTRYRKLTEDKDITFVDHTEEESRKTSHPVMKQAKVSEIDVA